VSVPARPARVNARHILILAVISRDNLFDSILPLPVPHSLGAAAVIDRWHNQPTILRRIELAGCIAQPQIDAALPVLGA
jgi:hypothetical protein